MTKTTFATASLAALLLSGAAIGSVSAQTVASATGLSMEDAIAIAVQEVPGAVQEAELENEDGMQVFEIEILTAAGREMEIEIAAATGEIIAIEAEDDDDDT